MSRLALSLAYIVALSCCGPAETLVLMERTVIFPSIKAPQLISWTCYAPPPDITGYWTPGEMDLDHIEDTLLAYLRSHHVNTNKDWSQFRRQIAGVKRGNDMLLFLYYFYYPDSEIERVKRRVAEGHRCDIWTEVPHTVMDGGDNFFRVLYSVKNRSFVWYECNPEA